MTKRNLLIFLVLGVTAVLVARGLTSGDVAPPPDEAQGSAAPAAGTREDGAGLPSGRSGIAWASWREDAEVPPDPKLPSEATETERGDPRLERVLEGLKGIDVYVEGESHGR